LRHEAAAGRCGFFKPHESGGSALVAVIRPGEFREAVTQYTRTFASQKPLQFAPSCNAVLVLRAHRLFDRPKAAAALRRPAMQQVSRRTSDDLSA
jgi:hypothetical protein